MSARRDIKMPLVVPKRGARGSWRPEGKPPSFEAGGEKVIPIPEPRQRDRTDGQAFNQRIIMEWEKKRPKMQDFLAVQ